MSKENETMNNNISLDEHAALREANLDSPITQSAIENATLVPAAAGE